MSNFWKVALAAGGLVALWLLSREDEMERGGAVSSRPGGKVATGSSPEGVASERSESSESGAAEASGESDGGIVRDGRMRGGTWNFSSGDASSDATGFLVLRDVPKSSISVDGRNLELRGGFRGFRDVPAGSHKLELEGYGGVKVVCDIDMPPGGCIVLIYEDTGGPPRLDPDRDWGPQYIGLAMGGAMGQALWAWPEEAE
jgi:hypothetical protein